VVVNLATHTATDGWGNADTLVSIEALRGSVYGDSFTGSAADEYFEGRAGSDTIDGAGGTDRVIYAGSHGAVNVNLNLPLFTGTASDGDGGTDTLTSIEDVTGSLYSDTILGSSANNRLEGAGSKYWTFANTGQQDNDSLQGLAGADTFVFNSALDAVNNVDTIVDFTTNQDKIELDHAIFTNLAVGSGITGKFAQNPGGIAATANDLILLDTSTGNLYYDADGLGGAAGVQFATLTSVTTIAATDFIVV
jgi:Ca2+-binding RTX toxin-like protein